MARNLTTAEAMSAALDLFAAQGIKITKEMRDAAVEAQANEMREAAKQVFDRKVLNVEELSSDEWVEISFSLADRVSTEIAGDKVGRGRGEVYERMFRIETPQGSLKVSLTQPVAE